MSKTRFTPWVVLACIGTLAGCTSGEDGTAGNTQLTVIVPNNSGQSSGPAEVDIQVVEYTIACEDGALYDPTTNPEINSGPTVDNNVTLSGVLEVIDDEDVLAATNGQDFGLDLANAYIVQGFMDLPPKDCTVQLRARDDDGEVICTATQGFTVTADDAIKVNVLMACGISYQAPVGMLDLEGDFQFNVSNYCPDLFVLNCIDSALDIRDSGLGFDVAATACQVRFRDADSQCGDSCDPQECATDSEGLTCRTECGTGPNCGTCNANSDNAGSACDYFGEFMCNGLADNAGELCTDESDCEGTAPVLCDAPQCPNGGCNRPCCPTEPTTTVTCAGVGNTAAIDCGGAGVPSPECTFTGDTLGVIGGAQPGPLNPGPGGFFVACALCNQDYIDLSQNTDPRCCDAGFPSCQGATGLAVTPGAEVTCTAVTTDGDVDCDKTKEVKLTCPGLSPCETEGCLSGEDCAFCSDGNDCTSDVCDDSSGAAVCPNGNLPADTACAAVGGGLCDGSGTCVAQGCLNDNPDCNLDGNPCTVGAPGTCIAGACTLPEVPGNNGGTCDSGVGSDDGSCDAGTCDPNDVCGIAGTPACPEDTNECTAAFCDTGTTPYSCGQQPVANGTVCDFGTGTDNGSCTSGVCTEVTLTIAADIGQSTWVAEVSDFISGTDGCYVFSPTLGSFIPVEVSLVLDVVSDGANNLTIDYNVDATNPALPLVVNAAVLGNLTVDTAVTGATPTSIFSGPESDAVGLSLKPFLQPGTATLLFGSADTGVYACKGGVAAANGGTAGDFCDPANGDNDCTNPGGLGQCVETTALQTVTEAMTPDAAGTDVVVNWGGEFQMDLIIISTRRCSPAGATEPDPNGQVCPSGDDADCPTGEVCLGGGIVISQDDCAFTIEGADITFPVTSN